MTNMVNSGDVYGRAGDWLIGTAKRHPEALLVLAAGCALLMRSGGGSSQSRNESAGSDGRWQNSRATEKASEAVSDLKLDRVFIGSCTNARIEDLRAAATVVNGHRVAGHVNAMVVPGSGLVKQQAETEGLDRIFKDAGFEWREAGCSMCLAMNPDKLSPGERCE